MLEPRRRGRVQGAGLADRRPHVSWLHLPGRAAQLDRRRVARVHTRRSSKDPRVIAALARRGINDMSTGAHRHLGLRRRCSSRSEHRGRRVGWTDVWLRTSGLGNPYANPVTGLHFVVDVNTHGASRDRGHRPGAAADDGRIRAEAGPGPAPARRRQAAGDRPAATASRSRLTATCCAGSAGRCGSASTRARGW